MTSKETDSSSESNEAKKGRVSDGRQGSPVVRSPKGLSPLPSQATPVARIKILKVYKFSGVVIRPENVRELARLVSDDYDQGLSKQQNVSLKFVLITSDGTLYESESSEFLSAGGLLDTRRIISIEMTYYNLSERKSISVDLRHSLKSGKNEAVVSGYEEVWAYGVLKRIEDVVSHWEKQLTWPSRYRWLLRIVFTIGFAILWHKITVVIGLIIAPFLEKYVPLKGPVPEWLVQITPIIIYTGYLADIIVGWIWSFIPVAIIQDLYPQVELITGPEYVNTERRKRTKLYAFLSLAIVPIVVSFLYELLKLLLS